MKEIPEINSSIKPQKLQEEIPQNVINNPQNIQQKPPKKIITLKINKHYQNISFCFFYLLSLGGLISLFVLNYTHTKTAFIENKNIILPPQLLCNKVITLLIECAKVRNINSCYFENKVVENCYEESRIMNQVCYIFISELELCVRKNHKSYEDQCKKHFRDLVRCGTSFRYLQIEKDNIKELLNF